MKPRKHQGRRVTRPAAAPSASRTRHMLAIGIVTVALLNGFVVVFLPQAQPVFDKLFQVVLLVVGYYFGRR